MAKYLVLTTCHTNGRMCREGETIEIAGKVENKYLKPVDGALTKDSKPEGTQSLASMVNKPNVKTGMVAPGKEKEESQADEAQEKTAEELNDEAIKEATEQKDN